MNQLPFGVMAKGFLHGFATLYGLFIVGSLFIFGMSFVLPEGAIRNTIMAIALLCFFALCIVGVVLRCKKPDIFSVREEYFLTIRTEGSKIPGGEIVREITQLEEPKRFPQIKGERKETREAQ